MPHAPNPGLLILHGNRLEDLAQTVLAWLQRQPLGWLEEEHFLVQSNGMAEWLKMQIAGQLGVCAATRVELPARFVWRAYRAVLGAEAVPAVSALDKRPLTWRLMRLLPALAAQPGFEPVAGFLRAGLDAAADSATAARALPATRLLQLARRLADLFDQYQVYRSDWLQDWAEGHDRLRPPAGGPQGALPLPPEQRWQALLWRAVLAELTPEQRAATRAQLHPRFLAALRAGAPPPVPMAASMATPALPQRLVLFGTTHIPHPTLEALAALAARCQVLIAVPNPCRWHWADIVEGGEPLRQAARRHAHRGGLDTGLMAPQDLHAHGHPLLAAWGRQGRDFIRQLDAFDDVQRTREAFDIPRIDLFDDAPGRTMLQQLQADIRELEPLLPGAPPRPLAPGDRSIVFHVAHSALREVEVLHDQLLHRLAQPGTPEEPALSPRDIVVMVPDIDAFAPAIRAVFGQFPRGHARHIPWGLADQRERGRHPLLLALDALLQAPTLRFAFSELQAWLDVPAISRRMGLRADELPTLLHWLQDAGVRWGLHAEQRAALGLGACGDTNSWAFGVRRMLLGYATGVIADAARADADAGPERAAGGFAGIEPYAEVAGLDAQLAGCAAEWLHTLQRWWADAVRPRTPQAWAERLRLLLAELFEPSDDTERAWLAALDQALDRWLQACDSAQFDSPLPLAAVREAWLDALDEPDAARRFKAGGVTFCTLLPLRAIPFGMVCLLGLNEADYPRSSARADFDLMALPGLARPGDRSRRHDDRQLMLDALLSARQALHISWAGRSPRDNSDQPPSVLVGQLREHLAAVWGLQAVLERTTLHPLQPFSRRYFEAAGSAESAASGPALPMLFTYAVEWRQAHAAACGPGDDGGVPVSRPPQAAEAAGGAAPLTLALLQQFLRNPVQAFFRHRLQVRFADLPSSAQDDEAFATTGLERWQLLDEALRHLQDPLHLEPGVDADALRLQVQAHLARQRRAGRLPLGGPGLQAEQALLATLQPMLAHARLLASQHPAPEPLVIDVSDPDDASLRLLDQLTDARADGPAGGRAGGPFACAGGSADAPADATVAADVADVADPVAPSPGPLWLTLLASKICDSRLRHARSDKLLAPWLAQLAAAAMGRPLAAAVIGANAVARLPAPEPEQARQTLLGLMRACRQGLAGTRPWPVAVCTGVAALQADSAFGNPVRQAFEGSDFSSVPGEGAEACLARLFPDADSLFAEPGFVPACHTLYGAYAEWLAHSVTLEELPGQQAGADEDDEAEDSEGATVNARAEPDTDFDADTGTRTDSRSAGSSRRRACA